MTKLKEYIFRSVTTVTTDKNSLKENKAQTMRISNDELRKQMKDACKFYNGALERLKDK